MDNDLVPGKQVLGTPVLGTDRDSERQGTTDAGGRKLGQIRDSRMIKFRL